MNSAPFDVLEQIQQAVYAVLSGDSVLMSMVTGMYIPAAPEKTTFPYITLSMITVKALDTFVHSGHTATATFTCVSQQPGMKQVLAMAARVDDLLDQQALSPLQDYAQFMTNYVSSHTSRMSDGITRQCQMVYDIFTESLT